MPLTHDFKETIRARAQRDPDFRQALLREAVECVIHGDLATGKAVLRDYVNATTNFHNLEKRPRAFPQEPPAHPWPNGQPIACEPFQHPDPPPKGGRRSFRAGALT